MFIEEYPGRRFGHLWQRDYHDHVVKDPGELDRIRQYIRTNVRTWKDDDNYVSNETKTENPNKTLLATATSPQIESESTPPPPEL
jgi:hypothetical protein